MPQSEIQQHTVDELSSLTLVELKALVESNGLAVARLGGWSEKIDVKASLADRIPVGKDVVELGFDAGTACALGLIPPQAQKLIAILHAAYTPEAVAQVRSGFDPESKALRLKDANSPAAWWLAACAICKEEGTDEAAFKKQLIDFKVLIENPLLRLEAANKKLNLMLSSFDMSRGYAYGEKDGCQQGAYIAGYSFAVLHEKTKGIYFIGTFHKTLGLENFIWSTDVDDKGCLKSGPVHGNQQFVKCASEAELERAIKEILQNPLFSIPSIKQPTTLQKRQPVL